MKLSGWGRFPQADCEVFRPGDEAAVRARVLSGATVIARGAGRAYGDAALNPEATLLSDRLDRILAFDPKTGVMIAEAGVMLSDIVELWTPRGWFPPVTPGTRFVTLGGMVASDVHGKNHHAHGAFSRHVEWLDLMLADGSVVRCSPAKDAELFWATCGGMGLTGFILRLAFRMTPIESPWIRQTTFRAESLAETLHLFEAHQASTYSVSWIDCLARGARQGRSLVYLGEHATAAEAPGRAPPKPRPRRLPVDLPGIALNPLSVSLFNELYYRRGKPGVAFTPIEPYFYPLDSILDWNRAYGARGFMQHQGVIPKPAASAALKTMLSLISAHGVCSPLAVLKLLGPEAGPLSFPMEGYTLAVDFPVSEASLVLMRELDAVVVDHGGRIYLTKDARTARSSLTGYRLDAFAEVRDRVDPDRRFRSLQSERLGL